MTIAILLAAGCGGGVTQPTVPCNPIIKHDTVRVVIHDTLMIAVMDTVRTLDTLIVTQQAWRFDQWRDTVVLDSNGSIAAFRPDSHDTTSNKP